MSISITICLKKMYKKKPSSLFHQWITICRNCYKIHSLPSLRASRFCSASLELSELSFPQCIVFELLFLSFVFFFQIKSNQLCKNFGCCTCSKTFLMQCYKSPFDHVSCALFFFLKSTEKVLKMICSSLHFSCTGQNWICRAITANIRFDLGKRRVSLIKLYDAVFKAWLAHGSITKCSCQTFLLQTWV